MCGGVTGLEINEFAVHHQGITTAIKADAEYGNKRFHLAYETIFAKMSIGEFFEKCGNKVLGNYVIS